MENKRCIDCNYYDFRGCIHINYCENQEYYENNPKELKEENKPKEEDKVINPDYYSNSDIDVIEFCFLNKLEFWVGNVLKYCVRSGKKSIETETDDLRKAIRYIERRIEFINRK